MKRKYVRKRERSFSRPPGYSGCKKVFSQYKANARTRDINFELSFEQFQKLTSGDYFYCGSAPYMVAHATGKVSKRASENSSYIHNGVDRVDSTQSYNISNCVSCCRTCNRIKWNMTTSQFLSQVKQIFSYQNMKEI